MEEAIKLEHKIPLGMWLIRLLYNVSNSHYTFVIILFIMKCNLKPSKTKPRMTNPVLKPPEFPKAKWREFNNLSTKLRSKHSFCVGVLQGFD